MKPPAFHYERPETVDDAVDILTTEEDNARVLAGGQSMVPRMNFRSINPEVVVDLNRIDNLDYVRSDGDELLIGAMTRQSDARENPEITAQCPLLTEALQYVGHKPTRHRGTIGGNVANADPRSELPAVLTALGGSVVVQNGDGEREIAISDFFRGGMKTSLETGELLTEVRVPTLSDEIGYAFEEWAIVDWDWPVVGVASTLEVDDGECRNVRVAYAGVDGSPIRLEEAEAAVEGESIGDDTFDAAAAVARETVSVTEQEDASSVEKRVNQISESEHPSATVHADPAYKRDLVEALTRRALKRAHDRI